MQVEVKPMKEMMKFVETFGQLFGNIRHTGKDYLQSFKLVKLAHKFTNKQFVSNGEVDIIYTLVT